MSSADLLIEIGTEELPPKALLKLSRAFEAEIKKGLKASALIDNPAVTSFATPRRLAIHIELVAEKQADQRIDKQGPLVSAAFDDDGKPTPAALGFAKSCGVDINNLARVESDKGEKLAYSEEQTGKPAKVLIPEIVLSALTALPIPKRMRWGASDAEFVRPVKWVIVMHGSESIDCQIYGVKSGVSSRGHRFHHSGDIRISSASLADYENSLESAHVVASFAKRRSMIEEQVTKSAQSLGGKALMDNALLDEVTALVEWPVALAGGFEDEFLSVPHEALIYTMKDNQKYFPVVDDKGGLLPHFITVSNIKSKDPAQVISGNERVVRPRLADAAFFWEQDKKKPLEDHVESLNSIVFQKELGTLKDKTDRLVALVKTIAEKMGCSSEHATRAAALSKCDLMTDMVGEFPAMQGVAGRYYATAANEPAEVAAALEEYYMPKQSGGDLPSAAVSQALALADRIDTLTGIFGIGQKPTGSKDPFALRRASLGVLRIIIEKKLDLDLLSLIKSSRNTFENRLTNNDVVDDVFYYCVDRINDFYSKQGFDHKEIYAIRDVLLRDNIATFNPLDFDIRLHAVSKFQKMPEAKSLAESNKRIRNMLKKSNNIEEVNEAVLVEDAELELFSAIKSAEPKVRESVDKTSYESALKELCSLSAPVDKFFDDVMVMVDDQKLQANRLALLARTRNLFLLVADVSVFAEVETA